MLSRKWNLKRHLKVVNSFFLIFPTRSYYYICCFSRFIFRLKNPITSKVFWYNWSWTLIFMIEIHRKPGGCKMGKYMKPRVKKRSGQRDSLANGKPGNFYFWVLILILINKSTAKPYRYSWKVKSICNSEKFPLSKDQTPMSVKSPDYERVKFFVVPTLALEC